MKKIAALMAAVFLFGCQTPYQEIGANGGVSAYRMSDDSFRISVRGNGYTDNATAADYVLLKAAETTVAYGGRYFAVVNVSDASSSQTVYNPGGVIYGYGYATYLPATVDNIYKPGGDVIIRLFASRPPNIRTIDAEEVIRNIGPRIKRASR